MRLVLASALLVALTACADVTARTEAPEHLALVQEFGGSYDSGDVQAYVQRIGDHVARAAGARNRFAFTVLNDDTPNALSLPDGNVYVTRGLLALANSEAELAGVLAHEVAHVTQGHALARVHQAVSDGLAIAILQSVGSDPDLTEMAALEALMRQQDYSREQELQADSLAIRIMAAAGFEPRALPGFLHTLIARDALQARIDGLLGGPDEHDLLSSHPRTIDRVRHITATAEAAPRGRIGRDEHLRVVDGLMYGADPSRGVLRGNRYMHPGEGFTFSVPEEFALVDDDETVVAMHPSGALILFESDRAPLGVDMPSYVQDWLPGVDLYGLGTTRVGGMPAATAAVRIRGDLGPMDGRVVAVRYAGDRVYRFLLATPVEAGPALAQAQYAAAASFRRLSAAEAAEIRPYRLRTVQVPPGMPVEQLAATVPGSDAAAELRVLNGLEPGEVLPGGLAKIYTD